jgi:hypothetical protein
MLARIDSSRLRMAPPGQRGSRPVSLSCHSRPRRARRFLDHVLRLERGSARRMHPSCQSRPRAQAVTWALLISIRRVRLRTVAKPAQAAQFAPDFTGSLWPPTEGGSMGQFGSGGTASARRFSCRSPAHRNGTRRGSPAKRGARALFLSLAPPGGLDRGCAGPAGLAAPDGATPGSLGAF